MCPVCLTTLAVTVATTTGASGGVAALALRIRRSLAHEGPRAQPRKDAHESIDPPVTRGHALQARSTRLR
jgi:hypothetical protein